MAGAAKTVHVTFNISEGPKVRIRDLEFVGNEKVSDRTLASKMKENKAAASSRFMTGGGTYKEEQVRRGRREGHRATTATTATSPRRSGSRI